MFRSLAHTAALTYELRLTSHTNRSQGVLKSSRSLGVALERRVGESSAGRSLTHLLYRALSLMCLGVTLMMSPLSHHIASAQDKSAPLSLDQAREQGLLYFNENMLDLARSQFDLAYQAPGGKADFIVVYYRGFLAEKRLELEVAFQMAELAVTISNDDQERAQAQELFEQLQGRFGYVEIKRNPNETNTKGRIYLETARRILNRKKREQFQSIRERFRSNDIQVPTRIYLPYGRYTANGVPFQIKRNSDETDSVEVILHIIQDTTKQAGGSTWLYTGVGVASAALLGVGTYFLLKPEARTENNTRIGFANP